MSTNRVGDYLDKYHADIIEEWETDVRAELPKAESLPRLVLLDHTPQMLQKLAQWLRADVESRRHEAESASADFGDIADFHAAGRIEVGFDLRQVVTEYRILRRCILRRIEGVRGRSDTLERRDRSRHRGERFALHGRAGATAQRGPGGTVPAVRRRRH